MCVGGGSAEVYSTGAQYALNVHPPITWQNVRWMMRLFAQSKLKLAEVHILSQPFTGKLHNIWIVDHLPHGRSSYQKPPFNCIIRGDTIPFKNRIGFMNTGMQIHLWRQWQVTIFVSREIPQDLAVDASGGIKCKYNHLFKTTYVTTTQITRTTQLWMHFSIMPQHNYVGVGLCFAPLLRALGCVPYLGRGGLLAIYECDKYLLPRIM